MSTLSPSISDLATDAVDSKPIVRLVPPRGWQLINLRELWRFRELLYFFIWRDVKVRYKQTFLGVAWAVLQPAMMMAVFTVFLGRMAGLSSGTLPYSLFVYAGLLPWTFFATGVTNASHSVVTSERLVTKIYFPRLTIPLSSVGAAAVDFVVALGLLGVLMVWHHVPPSSSIWAAPLILAAITLTALGVGTLVAAMNVAYRDFRYVVPFMVQFWMFATPSIYQAQTHGSGTWIKVLLALNPMTALIAAFRSACLGGTIDWHGVGISSVFGVLVFFAGCFYFRKVEHSFADTI